MVLICEDEAEGCAEGTYITGRRMGKSCAGSSDVGVAGSHLGKREEGMLLAWMEERGKGRVQRGVVEEKGRFVTSEDE